MNPADLDGRRVLVTAGPTWVMLDAVRHISNFSTGYTGLTIARELARNGAEVVVLKGPGTVELRPQERGRVRVEPFVTFDDLREAVRRHVGSLTYDVLVHAAAVSDYRPATADSGKLSSTAKELVIRLVPTSKIVDEVKSLDPGILLVKFKLEVGKNESELLAIASASRERSGAELIVANDLSHKREETHRAFLMDEQGVIARTETTESLAETLAEEIARRLSDRPRRIGSARLGAG